MLKYNKLEAELVIKKTYRPGLVLPITMTLLGVAIYWGIWMDLIDQHYNKMGIFVAVLALTMLIIGACWTSYYFRMLQYKKEVSDYLRDPGSYRW